MAEKKVVKRTGLKNVRKAKRRHARNVREKILLKKSLKSVRLAIGSKAQNVVELLTKAVSIIDKAAERKIIHANRASRLKSRLMLAYNKNRAAA